MAAHLDPTDQPLSAASDLELVELTRNGDSAAFGELWVRHSAAGRAVARSHRFDADDLLSESFARIFQAIGAGGGPTAAFRPYLFTTIRNVSIQWGRAKSADASEDLDLLADPASEEEASLAALDRGLTVQAFRSLPTRWQEALWYSEVEQMSSQEIAPLLGMKANAVSALTYRAREGLRQAWIQAHLARTSDPECSATIERLGSFTRGMLGTRESKRVRDHLETCASCTIVAEEARQVGSRLALVLLPLAAGVAGATGYVAWMQAGGAAAGGMVAAAATVPVHGGVAGVGVHGGVAGAGVHGVSAGASGAGTGVSGVGAGAGMHGAAVGATGAGASGAGVSGVSSAAGVSLAGASAGASSAASAGATGTAAGTASAVGSGAAGGSGSAAASSSAGGAGAGAGATAGGIGAAGIGVGAVVGTAVGVLALAGAVVAAVTLGPTFFAPSSDGTSQVDAAAPSDPTVDQSADTSILPPKSDPLAPIPPIVLPTTGPPATPETKPIVNDDDQNDSSVPPAEPVSALDPVAPVIGPDPTIPPVTPPTAPPVTPPTGTPTGPPTAPPTDPPVDPPTDPVPSTLARPQSVPTPGNRTYRVFSGTGATPDAPIDLVDSNGLSVAKTTSANDGSWTISAQDYYLDDSAPGTRVLSPGTEDLSAIQIVDGIPSAPSPATSVTTAEPPVFESPADDDQVPASGFDLVVHGDAGQQIQRVVNLNGTGWEARDDVMIIGPNGVWTNPIPFGGEVGSRYVLGMRYLDAETGGFGPMSTVSFTLY